MSNPDNAPTASIASIATVLLRQFRMEQNISKSRFAEMSGLSNSGWAKIEAGQSAVSLATVHRIADAFDISLATIFQAIEASEFYLYEQGWQITSERVSNEPDDLITASESFFNSNEEFLIRGRSGRLIPVFKCRSPAPVFRYASKKQGIDRSEL